MTPYSINKIVIHLFTHESIYDEMFYNFEVIITNDESNEISYFNAYVWDYYKDDILVSLLETFITGARGSILLPLYS